MIGVNVTVYTAYICSLLMSYILHIDTSGATGMVALANDGLVLTRETTDDTRNQAAAINVMIEKVLAHASIKMTDLGAVAVCAGPGSYTGLRIGMATAKGLCYALDIPLLTNDKLTLLASNKQSEYAAEYDTYTTILKAREGEYFVTVLDNVCSYIIPPKHLMQNEGQLPPNSNNYVITDLSPEELKNIIIIPKMVDYDVSVNILHWAKVAKEGFDCKKFVKLSTAEPFYLKEVYTHK